MGFLLGLLKSLLGLFLGKSETTVAVEQARAAGSAQEAVVVTQTAVKAEAAVAQAEANAPKTKAAVINRLNEGSF